MVEPLCKHFGNCGGCSTQHISYDLQLENKKKHLEIITKVPVKIFSDKEYNYRNRMDLIFTSNSLGLRKKSEWQKIISIDSCPIADEKINTLIQEIQSNFTNIDAFDVKKHSGTFRYAVIRSANDSSISFVLNSKSSHIAEAVEKIKSFSKKTSAENVLVTYVPAETDVSTSSDYFIIKGNDYLTIDYQNKTFHYSIQSFFQNNHLMARKMHEYCSEILSKYQTFENNLLKLNKEDNMPQDDDLKIIAGYCKYECSGNKYLITEDEHFWGYADLIIKNFNIHTVKEWECHTLNI